MTAGRPGGFVCVVDDDADIREMIRFLLEGAGYAVEEAADGRGALARLREHPDPCCLVLLDLMMPGMNGWELLGELRRDPSLSRVPVAVLTGARVPLSADDSASTVAVLVKPVEADTLLGLVDRYCQHPVG